MKNEFHGRRNRWGGFKGRTLITLVLVLSMIISVPLLSKAADETPSSSKRFDKSQKGKLTVIASDKSVGFEGLEGLDKMELTIDLYQLASAEAISGSDGYTFDWGGYTDLEAKYNELANASADAGDVADEPEGVAGDSEEAAGGTESLNSNDWHELSQAAADLVLGEGSTIEPTVKNVSGTGKIEVDNLKAGLYLLVVRGGNTKNYVTKLNDDTVTRAVSKQYSYLFLPQLVSLPSKGDRNVVNEGGDWNYSNETNTADGGLWQYGLTVYLKAQRDNGKLKIVKNLLNYYDDGNKEPATFVFSVVATLDGIDVYQNEHTIDFTDPGNKDIVIDNIPIGSKVTITEIYSGAHYSLAVEGDDGTRTIEEILPDITENEVRSENTVEFTNDYDDRITGGHGITNHFVYKDGQWKMEQIVNDKVIGNW